MRLFRGAHAPWRAVVGASPTTHLLNKESISARRRNEHAGARALPEEEEPSAELGTFTPRKYILSS